MSGIDDFSEEIMPGHCATVAALVLALDERGVLPKTEYRRVLQRLWLGMPEEAAVGEAGAVIERVLDLLGADDVAYDGVALSEPHTDRRILDGHPVNDDRVAYPLRAPLQVVLQAV